MPSGLQLQVIHLYRRALRAIKSKPPSARPKFLLTVRHAFRSPAVSAKDFSAIEFLLRRGERQVETWADPRVKDCWVSGDMRKWARERGWNVDK